MPRSKMVDQAEAAVFATAWMRATDDPVVGTDQDGCLIEGSTPTTAPYNKVKTERGMRNLLSKSVSSYVDSGPEK